MDLRTVRRMMVCGIFFSTLRVCVMYGYDRNSAKQLSKMLTHLVIIFTAQPVNSDSMLSSDCLILFSAPSLKFDCQATHPELDC